MELWIRSQNKKCLLRASMFDLDNDETGIYCYSNEENFCLLGKYKSKERALEILDEIQGVLIDYSQMSSVVYVMPKE